MKIFFLILIPLLMYLDQRIVYVFYTTSGKSEKGKQIEEFSKDKTGLTERNIEVREINMNEANADAKKWKVDSHEPFTLILVGKDGSEKLRSKKMVTTKQLFGIIDQMPMRQAEMKKQ